MKPLSLALADARYPARLRKRLGEAAPAQLTALGNLDLLALPKTALFCSARCPGSVILSTYDQAAKWRDAGRCLISGFHSPVEQECLRILLRGASPIILCPARNLPTQIPTPLKTPLAQGRLLMLSGFGATDKRVTADLAYRRNFLVAALADDAYFGHITPGGQSEQISNSLRSWRVPFFVGHNVENPD
jgi:predicted Rossmann fold nucleotide-binding protein DprA/Smf involved in DNA uptake